MTPSMFRKWQKEMRKYGMELESGMRVYPWAIVRHKETGVPLAVQWCYSLTDAVKAACREAILRHGSADK